jgi:hypothetical protein
MKLSRGLKTNIPKATTGKEKIEGFDITGKGLNTIKGETKIVAQVNSEINKIK